MLSISDNWKRILTIRLNSSRSGTFGVFSLDGEIYRQQQIKQLTAFGRLQGKEFLYEC